MTIKDCITRAVYYLGLKDYAKSLEEGTDDALDTKTFVLIAQNVISEICTDYFPIKITQEIIIKNDGRFMFKDLLHPPVEIYSLIKDGKNYLFETKYNRIETDAVGDCRIEYSVVADTTDITAPLQLCPKVDQRIVSYGIAAEYCILNGLDDAVLWDKKYKDALRKALTPKTEKRIKKRRWL